MMCWWDNPRIRQRVFFQYAGLLGLGLPGFGLGSGAISSSSNGPIFRIPTCLVHFLHFLLASSNEPIPMLNLCRGLGWADFPPAPNNCPNSGWNVVSPDARRLAPASGIAGTSRISGGSKWWFLWFSVGFPENPQKGEYRQRDIPS